MRRLVLMTGLLLVLPATAAGDMLPPPQPLPVKYHILHVGEEARGYRFWLKSPNGTLEPLPLRPGQPYRIPARPDGGVGEGASFESACVVAVHRSLADFLGEDNLLQAIRSPKNAPDILKSGMLIFFETSSRKPEAAHWIIRIEPGKRLYFEFPKIDYAEEDTTWWWRGLIVGGILLSALAVWLGLRFVRRRQLTQPNARDARS